MLYAPFYVRAGHHPHTLHASDRDVKGLCCMRGRQRGRKPALKLACSLAGTAGERAFVCVMSMTCQRMRGRGRRFLAIICLMTSAEKSMLVMAVQPSSYLRMHAAVFQDR